MSTAILIFFKVKKVISVTANDICLSRYTIGRFGYVAIWIWILKRGSWTSDCTQHRAISYVSALYYFVNNMWVALEDNHISIVSLSLGENTSGLAADILDLISSLTSESILK